MTKYAQGNKTPSLQGKLIRWLAGTTTIVALLAGSASFYQSYLTALEYQDNLLRQTAALIDPKINANVDIQSDVTIYVRQIGGSVAGGQLPFSMSDGFHTLRFQDDDYRVYVYSYPTGERIAFSQETNFRDKLAYTGAWSSTLPLLILIPLISLICFFIIRRFFKPLHQLSRHIEQRKDNLEPLSEEQIPVEIKGFIAAINGLLQRVSLSVQQQQRFIADAAHELRSPLTALSLQAERLSQTALPAESQQQLTALQDSIRRHRHLLEQLLSLARQQAHQMPIQDLKPVSMLHIFQQVVQTLYPIAEQKQIDLGIRESQDYTLMSDDVALFTIFKNLVDNAIRYIPAQGQIDLAIEHYPHCIVLIVEDNGLGIPVEQRERVLDPFYRILGTQVEGSGLGLSIVHTIVQRLNAKLYLKDSSHFAHGLRVEIHFQR
ncbi:MAG: HAMP domain-containing sensor histidine kinase [Acinetobacter sp.]|nr:HAMP domain-containing sensor histidine kinase [Acinetobacter sp.]